MSVIVDGCLFQSCLVLGENDILYTVTLVYGTKSFCDHHVLLWFARTMDSDSGILTKLCLILKIMVRLCIFWQSGSDSQPSELTIAVTHPGLGSV